MKRAFAFVMVAAALAGCQQAKVAVTGCKPPNYAPIYAGAGTTTCQENETVADDKGTARFAVPDVPSVVAAFYKTRAEQAGLATSGFTTATDGTIALSASDTTPAHRRLHIDIKPNGSGSTVMLTWENAPRQKNL